MGFRFINKRRNHLLSDFPKDNNYYLTLHMSNGATLDMFNIPRDEIVKSVKLWDNGIYGNVECVDISRYGVNDIKSRQKIGKLEAA